MGRIKTLIDDNNTKKNNDKKAVKPNRRMAVPVADAGKRVDEDPQKQLSPIACFSNELLVICSAL